MATIVGWIDRRFDHWDWGRFAREKRVGRNAGAGRVLTLTDIGVLSGAARSEMTKLSDLKGGMTLLLSRLKTIGAFERGGQATSHSEEAKVLMGQWKNLRSQVMRLQTRRHLKLIDVQRWCQQLEEMYDRNLERLYRENVKGGRVANGGKSRSRSRFAPLSEHLLVVWEDQFNGATRFKGMLPRPLLRADLYNFFATNGQKRTAFQMYDVRSSDGEVFSVTLHQVRHWLSTAMLRAGATETAVDVWMGRSPGQSRQYDHRTVHERAEKFRLLYMADNPPLDYLGSKVIEWRSEGFGVEEIAELVEARLQVLHFVPWGMCSRDLVLAPCNKALMCLRGFGTDQVCRSFHIDPTDLKARDAIKELHRNYSLQLRVFEPNLTKLRKSFEESFDSSSVLDQHVQMMISIIRGCEAALAAYAAAESFAGQSTRVLDFVAHV